MLPTTERSVPPPSAASCRRCVAVAPPERSPRVLVIPLALLPCPLPVVAPVSPLAPRNRRGRIGVIPVACAATLAIVRHNVLSLLLGWILINTTSRQIGVFQIKILSKLIRIKRREYVGQLAK